MVKDQIVLGSLVGMVSGVIKNIPTLILVKMGILKFTMIQIAASVMLKTESLIGEDRSKYIKNNTGLRFHQIQILFSV